jgi:hypothetical protein
MEIDMDTTHIATIAAFANKFDDFTGAIRDEATKGVIKERFNSFDEARNWVRTKSWEMFGPVHYAAVRRKKTMKGEYYANLWT